MTKQSIHPFHTPKLNTKCCSNMFIQKYKLTPFDSYYSKYHLKVGCVKLYGLIFYRTLTEILGTF